MADTANVLDWARQLLGILANDEPRLLRIDAYIQGEQDEPYMPDNADAEYRLLAERCISNWMPLLISTPCQALYVDSFRRGSGQSSQTDQGAMAHWQRSRLDARQLAVHRGAAGKGHSYTLTERPGGRKDAPSITKGLSAHKTAALYEDPANDHTPVVALSVTKWPTTDGTKVTRGSARMWDGTWEYLVTFESIRDLGPGKVSVGKVRKHGASECPVTRFACYIDLEGRTTGVVEPMIPLQNRINQTVFDLLVAQTGGSFKIRTISGMAPPVQMVPVRDNPDDPDEITDYEPLIGPDGSPIPKPINMNAKKFLFAEDPDTKFGSLDETPLDGYINSIDMSIRHLSAIAQVPPHHLLGQIANLSAEALQAAETSLLRMVEELRASFGESWERVFRLAAELDGNAIGAEDWSGEVIWRDMEQKSLAQAADALGKLKDSLEIPAQGLWPRVPGATSGEIQQWKELHDSQPLNQLADSVDRATKASRTNIPPAAA